MIRKLLEDNGIITNDLEFKEVMDLVTSDIKFNRINFGKRTNKIELIEITERSLHTLRRCFDLDGTELYGVDGQTICDIGEMVIEHVKNFLEGEEWNLKI
ncbi:hypothetical protein DP125_08740 [Clostridium tetani]|uniref:RNA polymerase n=1 Tax=Clostridium phage phiCT19406C TaxID=1567011 RepID=UPI00054DA49B|nr:hypothetical protein [Clostridium tetani]YP_009218036.1 RNA polymerase [Clostridium phage phiCT19406C]AJA42830.1 hypothetical protein phiCT19406C_07 [Clostridium phage phiCT19406C]KHO32600.1 hypothetical protein OR63_06550 [Clostridium tetani]RXI59880.1 hypothetical protein DP125_08740 [Clostridium tetani]RXI62312.1 hypothetical protein DP132_06535 [Clostridium tetani]RXI69555.1 hypothetical protein DP121_08845 [Clostridium tetani]